MQWLLVLVMLAAPAPKEKPKNDCEIMRGVQGAIYKSSASDMVSEEPRMSYINALLESFSCKKGRATLSGTVIYRATIKDKTSLWEVRFTIMATMKNGERVYVPTEMKIIHVVDLEDVP